MYPNPDHNFNGPTSLNDEAYPPFIIAIDGHVCWNSNRQLQFTICRPRKIEKTNVHFPFPFAANKRKFAVSIFCLKQTNESCRFLLGVHGSGFLEFRGSRNFVRISFYFCGIPETLRHKDIYNYNYITMEVCCFFVCWRRNNQKLFVCKRTKRT